MSVHDPQTGGDLEGPSCFWPANTQMQLLVGCPLGTSGPPLGPSALPWPVLTEGAVSCSLRFPRGTGDSGQAPGGDLSVTR